MPTNSSTLEAQARTLETAVHWGEAWTKFEVDLAIDPEFKIEEVALALGRTVYAIQSIREAVRLGEVDASGRRRSKPQPAFRFQFGKGWRD
jgi:hypothetical protein